MCAKFAATDINPSFTIGVFRILHYPTNYAASFVTQGSGHWQMVLI